MRNLKKGFTLVELIVVITILAVLATIAFITLGDYPAQARDTKRANQAAELFKKLQAENATGYKTFIEGKALTDLTDSNFASTSADGVTIEGGKALFGKIDFNSLREDPKSFADTLNGVENDYIIFTAQWDEKRMINSQEDKSKRNCHAIFIKGEKKNATNTTCPTYITAKFE